ncbi:hypothetical protein G5V57_26715 [Nordella sp. HKS 07]|uniref:hypothetical protein n=1 Tax=Nordella sp. HKS 07 TaxID=2712222 RepID=UPI0013E1E009|nr:hypothetical protein [Nordella sp. HKS 07]QIG51005.1 hypothetical protein G5V57_26715 [Nordella sp. HKS 07]
MPNEAIVARDIGKWLEDLGLDVLAETGGGLQMEDIDCGRRMFCGGAAVAIAAMPLSIMNASRRAAAQIPQRVQPISAATFGPIKQARAGLLNVG